LQLVAHEYNYNMKKEHAIYITTFVYQA